MNDDLPDHCCRSDFENVHVWELALRFRQATCLDMRTMAAPKQTAASKGTTVLSTANDMEASVILCQHQRLTERIPFWERCVDTHAGANDPPSRGIVVRFS